MVTILFNYNQRKQEWKRNKIFSDQRETIEKIIVRLQNENSNIKGSLETNDVKNLIKEVDSHNIDSETIAFALENYLYLRLLVTKFETYVTSTPQECELQVLELESELVQILFHKPTGGKELLEVLAQILLEKKVAKGQTIRIFKQIHERLQNNSQTSRQSYLSLKEVVGITNKVFKDHQSIKLNSLKEVCLDIFVKQTPIISLLPLIFSYASADLEIKIFEAITNNQFSSALEFTFLWTVLTNLQSFSDFIIDDANFYNSQFLTNSRARHNQAINGLIQKVPNAVTPIKTLLERLKFNTQETKSTGWYAEMYSTLSELAKEEAVEGSISATEIATGLKSELDELEFELSVISKYVRSDVPQIIGNSVSGVVNFTKSFNGNLTGLYVSLAVTLLAIPLEKAILKWKSEHYKERRKSIKQINLASNGLFYSAATKDDSQTIQNNLDQLLNERLKLENKESVQFLLKNILDTIKTARGQFIISGLAELVFKEKQRNTKDIYTSEALPISQVISSIYFGVLRTITVYATTLEGFATAREKIAGIDAQSKVNDLAKLLQDNTAKS